MVVPRPRENRGRRKTIEDGSVVVQPEIRGCAQRHPVERFSRWLPNIVLVAEGWSGQAVRCGCACVCGCQTKHAKQKCDAPHARWLVRLALCSAHDGACGRHIRPVVRPQARGCGPMLASLSQSRRPTWSDCGACRGGFSTGHHVSSTRSRHRQRAAACTTSSLSCDMIGGLGQLGWVITWAPCSVLHTVPRAGSLPAREPRFGPTLLVAGGTGQSGTEACVVRPVTGQEWPSGAACRMLPMNGQGMGKVRLLAVLLATSRIMLVLPRGTGVVARVQSKSRKVS